MKHSIKRIVTMLSLNRLLAFAIISLPAPCFAAEPEEPSIVFSSGPEWMAPDMSEKAIKPGSALDLSSLADAPAGKHGRAIVAKDGSLAFERLPNVPQRLLGFTGGLSREDFGGKSKEQAHANAAKFAELVKRQGYNFWRFHMIDTFIMSGDASEDCELNPEKLDLADKLISELKKQGVYTSICVFAYRCGVKEGRRAYREDRSMKASMYLAEEQMRRNWETLASAMLNHVNPYTGLAWKDEPAIIFVEFFNEQEFAFRNIDKQPESVRKLFNERWREWLKGRYKTPAALAKAWGRPELDAKDSFEKLETPDGINGKGSDASDFGLFARDLALEEFEWCERIVRKLGYKGLVMQHNFARPLLDAAVRWECSPISAMNVYQTHPTNFVQPGSICRQSSSAGDAAGYWRHANAAAHLAGRPTIITEHNFAFWNKYQHEGGLVFPAYSALQGYSGITVHVNPVEVTRNGPVDCFSVARSPVARANEFLAAVFYRRADVKQARHWVEVQIPAAYISENQAGLRGINSEQMKIALMTGLSLSFKGLPRAAGLPTPKAPDIAIGPDSGVETSVGSMFANAEDSKRSEFKLNDFIVKLKARGILPAGNLSDPGNEVFQSENGEITLRAKENLMKVSTALSEAVTLEAGKSESVNCLEVKSSSVPAAVAAVSVDGKPLVESGRIVLVFSTDTANTGMQLSTDRSKLLKLGGMPSLLQTGKLSATLRNSNASKLALYALRVNGERIERLPFKALNNIVEIEIDTAKLKAGPAVFFELAADVEGK